MSAYFQGFGFVEWWKAIAVVLTGAFALLALIKDNKDEAGKLTRWGKFALCGIVVSSAGGLLAQIKESSDDAATERMRHFEVVSILTEQERLLRPLKIEHVFGEFRVPCEGAYADFCQSVRGVHGITPISAFDSFPGGRSTIILLAVRFFANVEEARSQLVDYDDKKSKYSGYMRLPLEAGNDEKCGMRVRVAPPENEVRLFIFASCPFDTVNNFGDLQSHLDLNGLYFVAQAQPSVPVPPLQPLTIGLVYSDAHADNATNFSASQVNGQTIYGEVFVAGGGGVLPKPTR